MARIQPDKQGEFHALYLAVVLLVLWLLGLITSTTLGGFIHILRPCPCRSMPGWLVDDLDLVTFPPGEVLYESGDPLEFVYFPTTCIVSMIFSTRNGSSTELAMTGNDGLVGIPLVLGGETTTHTVAVQNGGGAYRLRAEVMRWELDQGGSLQRRHSHTPRP